MLFLSEERETFKGENLGKMLKDFTHLLVTILEMEGVIFLGASPTEQIFGWKKEIFLFRSLRVGGRI